MLSTSHGFVFIHIPKTAGTSLTEILEPFSDDHSVMGVNGPLTESRELRGPITRTKHMSYREYAALLGDQIDSLALLTSLRHPLSRMLSLYFWRGEWLEERFPGARRLARQVQSARNARLLLRATSPYWDNRRFERLVARSVTQADLLRNPSGGIQRADWAFSMEAPGESLLQVGQLLGLAMPPLPPRHNVGPATNMIGELAQDSGIADYVYRAHREDYTAFGFGKFATDALE